MRGLLGKLGSGGLLAAAALATSVFLASGSTTPTVFQGCLTQGGTLINVSTQAAPACPAGSTAVSWNQQGPAGSAGGTTQILEVTSTQTFVVPAGVTHLLVEAWGGGGGGGSFNVTTCFAGGGGGSGGYVRTPLEVTPGEALVIDIGVGGAPGGSGASTTVMRGTTALVSAGGGAAGSSTDGAGGAGGQATSPAGLLRAGTAGGVASEDPMCQFGFGNGTIFAPVGVGGAPVQGTVATLASASAGGSGSNSGFQVQAGHNGELILSW